MENDYLMLVPYFNYMICKKVYVVEIELLQVILSRW